MDVLIQLIIILVIIISVLKRVKEVGKKGKDLGKGDIPGSILDMFDPEGAESRAKQKPSAIPAGQQKMPASEYSEPVENSGELSKEPLKPAEALYEPVEAPEIVEEDIYGTQPDSLIPQDELIEEPVYEAPKPVLSRPAQSAYLVPVKGLSLGFTGPQVINGIIMGEILGPPVSMRNNERMS